MQIGAGLELKATDHVSLGSGYRYFRALEANLEAKYDTHGPIIRVTYGF